MKKLFLLTFLLIKEPNENKKQYNSKPLVEIAREKVSLDDKKLIKQNAEDLKNP